MTIVQNDPYLTPYVVYDAPVNEKTRKIREMFDVDEKTGYPRHYSWRPMAQLGPEYSYMDPFTKLGRYNPDEYICQKVTMYSLGIGANVAVHWWINYLSGKKFHARLWRLFIATGSLLGAMSWTMEKTLQRQAQKNHLMMDYISKHPERFENIKRPKMREVLFYYKPAR